MAEEKRAKEIFLWATFILGNSKRRIRDMILKQSIHSGFFLIIISFARCDVRLTYKKSAALVVSIASVKSQTVIPYTEDARMSQRNLSYVQ